MSAGDIEGGFGKYGLDLDQPSEAQATEKAGERGFSAWSGTWWGRHRPFMVLERTDLGLADNEGASGRVSVGALTV